MTVDQQSVPGGIRSRYDAITSQLETLREMSERSDEDLARRSETVSRWSILLQLSHLGIVDAYIANGIGTALEKPPRNLDVKLSMIGRIILLTGFIPRGKGKAPEAVMPGAEVSPAEMREQIAEGLGLVAGLEARLPEFAGSTGRFPHPVLGGFTAAQWLKFIRTHHSHHFRIIRDIERAT